MKTSRVKTSIIIDEAGRLVLPRKIRKAIGVFGRTSVLVEVVDKTVRISASKPPATLLKRIGTRMVYAGPLPKNWESVDAIVRIRKTKSSGDWIDVYEQCPASMELPPRRRYRRKH